jgi:hypothetical protein
MAEKKQEPLGPQPPEESQPKQPYGKGKRSADKPVVAPDGHVNLSQEDIDARDSG